MLSKDKVSKAVRALRIEDSSSLRKSRKPRRLGKLKKLARRGMMPFKGDTESYLSTLVDPWEHPPVKLGFYTMVPTLLGSAYLRGVITVNAGDGSFALGFAPDITTLVLANVSGTAGATWTTGAASNAGALTTQLTSARVISGGLRIIVLYPLTDQPGILFGGVLNDSSLTNFRTTTPTALANLSSSEIGSASRGARVITRPLDIQSFEFLTFPLLGYVTTQPQNSSLGYVAGLGFPTGAQVWYEAILNLEGIPNVGASSIGINSSSLAAEPTTLSSHFLTPENLYNSVREHVNSAVVMDAVEGLTSLVHPGAGRLLHAARSAFGGGRHNNQARLVAGASQSGIGRGGSMVIEEIQSDGSWGRL